VILQPYQREWLRSEIDAEQRRRANDPRIIKELHVPLRENPRPLGNLVDLSEVRAEKRAEELIESLRSGVAQGVVVELPAEPAEHTKRLFRSIGASYIVKEGNMETCKIEGCARPAKSTTGPFAGMCREHISAEMSRRQSIRKDRQASPAQRPPRTSQAKLPLSANGAGPGSYTERAAAVLEAATRLDKAQAELEAAQQAYEEARAALA
jgi:hypothetical protein